MAFSFHRLGVTRSIRTWFATKK